MSYEVLEYQFNRIGGRRKMIIIAGRFNKSQEIGYWEVSERVTGWSQTCPGDYAMVHNNGGHDLVEVIGIMSIDKSELKSLGVHYGNVTQKVIMFVPKKYLEE